MSTVCGPQPTACVGNSSVCVVARGTESPMPLVPFRPCIGTGNRQSELFKYSFHCENQEHYLIEKEK